MFVEPFVRPPDQGLVEPLLADALLVARHQKDGLPFWIERVGDTPDTAGGIEAQFLHIGVSRAGKRIGSRPLQVRPEYPQHLDERRQLS